ncbi:MAG: hypothetical protein V1705_00185 [bacterium]
MRILVVKLGTEVLMWAGKIEQSIFNLIACQVKLLKEDEIYTVIVSSGAIQAGRERLLEIDADSSKLTDKDIAGIGSRHLLNRWGKAFEFYRSDISQLWVTYANWKNAKERESIKTGIFNALLCGFTPVLNENDEISDREIVSMKKGIGENDRLARMIAFLVEAKDIIFLTKAGGVFAENPQTNSRARMYLEVNTRQIRRLSLNGGSSSGRGGMEAKLREAALCARAGMRVAVAGVEEQDVLLKFIRAQSVGTRITFPTL